jgi:hypothetical protein
MSNNWQQVAKVQSEILDDNNRVKVDNQEEKMYDRIATVEVEIKSIKLDLTVYIL